MDQWLKVDHTCPMCREVVDVTDPNPFRPHGAKASDYPPLRF